MSDQNKRQLGVILAKRNSAESMACHLTVLAQSFKQTSKQPGVTPGECISAEQARPATRTLRNSRQQPDRTAPPLRLALISSRPGREPSSGKS
jgi:hypothetical protein